MDSLVLNNLKLAITVDEATLLAFCLNLNYGLYSILADNEQNRTEQYIYVSQVQILYSMRNNIKYIHC